MLPPKIQYINNPTSFGGWNNVQRRIYNMLQLNSALDYYYIIRFINSCTDAKIDVYCWDDGNQRLILQETTYASSWPLKLPHQGVLVKHHENC